MIYPFFLVLWFLLCAATGLLNIFYAALLPSLILFIGISIWASHPSSPLITIDTVKTFTIVSHDDTHIIYRTEGIDVDLAFDVSLADDIIYADDQEEKIVLIDYKPSPLFFPCYANYPTKRILYLKENRHDLLYR